MIQFENESLRIASTSQMIWFASIRIAKLLLRTPLVIIVIIIALCSIHVPFSKF